MGLLIIFVFTIVLFQAQKFRIFTLKASEHDLLENGISMEIRMTRVEMGIMEAQAIWHGKVRPFVDKHRVQVLMGTPISPHPD